MTQSTGRTLLSYKVSSLSILLMLYLGGKISFCIPFNNNNQIEELGTSFHHRKLRTQFYLSRRGGGFDKLDPNMSQILNYE